MATIAMAVAREWLFNNWFPSHTLGKESKSDLDAAICRLNFQLQLENTCTVQQLTTCSFHTNTSLILSPLSAYYTTGRTYSGEVSNLNRSRKVQFVCLHASDPSKLCKIAAQENLYWQRKDNRHVFQVAGQVSCKKVMMEVLVFIERMEEHGRLGNAHVSHAVTLSLCGLCQRQVMNRVLTQLALSVKAGSWAARSNTANTAS